MMKLVADLRRDPPWDRILIVALIWVLAPAPLWIWAIVRLAMG